MGSRRLLLGCIADDLTGATDLANELVRKGMRTVQVVGVPSSPPPADCDAVVVALKSRSLLATSAVEQSLAALSWFRTGGCERVYFKYCSTFDSTPAGNIGPVLEALASASSASGVIACPAFPATGRTVYQGHLFVGDRLLSESGMEHHPLNPMRDSDLVRVLQAQTRAPVGLISLREVRAGRIGERVDALAAQGFVAAIADAVDDDDLVALGAHCARTVLSSGGSGLGAGIAAALMGPGHAPAPASMPGLRGRRAVLAGSCSKATNRQVAVMAAKAPAFRLELDDGRDAAALVAEARDWIAAQDSAQPLLVYSTADPAEVARQRARFPDASMVYEAVLGELGAFLVDFGVDALIVAGGETSGAVIERLGVQRLAIAGEIDPGVPWTMATTRDGGSLHLALKSGNFGTDDFLLKAWDKVA